MESVSAKKKRAFEILKRLKREYATPGPFVEWSTPLELVVGTVLSAQCTDERVNQTTKHLFQTYQTAEAYARAKLPALEREIFSCGFYRTKARYLKDIGKILVEKFGGQVPSKLEDLLLLPGVSHKTAYIVLAKAFGKNVGLAVDTHVLRLAPRLGLSGGKNPDIISKELARIFDPAEYLNVNEYLITHGRAICAPRTPKCGICILRDLCPSAKLFGVKK